MDTTTSINVTTKVPGIHGWPDAPDGRAYLRDWHRHVFGITVELDGLEEDRQVEFHDLLRDVRRALAVWPRAYDERNFGSDSCEQIAHRLVEELRSRGYGGYGICVSVDEDGECGASVRAPALTPPVDTKPLSREDALLKAMRAARDELGVAGPDTPAPVANAIETLNTALWVASRA